MKTKSIKSIIKRHFAGLAKKPAVFSRETAAIVTHLYKDCPDTETYFIGCSLANAKALITRIPAKHLKRKRYVNSDGVVELEALEISDAAELAVLSWLITEGEDCGGVVELVPVAKTPVSAHPAKDMFALVLKSVPVAWPPEAFQAVREGRERRISVFRELDDSAEEMADLAAALPREHVRYFRLRVVGSEAEPADIVLLSYDAVMALAAWFECGRTTYVNKINAKLREFVERMDR